MIRSGARDADVRKRIAQTDFRSIKEIVAEACPVPNERTVQRLKDAHKSYNFSLRLPWQSAPAPRYYDEQDVLFYARILTMLAAKGIYPPVQVRRFYNKHFANNRWTNDLCPRRTIVES